MRQLKTLFFRPNLSRSNPDSGLIITEDTTKAPVTNPMIEFYRQVFLRKLEEQVITFGIQKRLIS